jgi:hypothetical protein
MVRLSNQGISAMLTLALTTAACGSSPTEPGPPPGPSPGVSTVRTMVYSSTSPAGPWAGPAPVTVTGHGVHKLVDFSPILMPDGSMLMYYSMANDEHLTDVPSIGVAHSTDGVNFVHRATVLTPGNVSDPFPLRIDALGTIRLFFSQKNPTVRSATSTDASGISFTADAGTRTTTGGVPGALKIGSTYFLYVHGGSDGIISYLTSPDGVTFTVGASTGLQGGSASPIDAGGGSYLMAYICAGNGPNTRVETHESCVASSTDGRTWTETSHIGQGSVPGLVKDMNGVFRVYVAAVVP